MNKIIVTKRPFICNTYFCFFKILSNKEVFKRTLNCNNFFHFYAFFLIFMNCKHWLVCNMSLFSPILSLICEIIAYKRTFNYNDYRFIFHIRSTHIKEKTQIKSIISI